MTKRIFRSIFLVTISVFLASIVLFMGVLYEYFSNVQRNQLRDADKPCFPGGGE